MQRLTSLVIKKCRQENINIDNKIFERQIYPNLIRYMELGNWNKLLIKSCFIGNGNIKYVTMALKNGANHIVEALIGAYKSGNIEIIDILQSQLEKYFNSNDQIKLPNNFHITIDGEYFYETDDRNAIVFRNPLEAAYYNGNINLIVFMSQYYSIYCNRKMYFAAMGGNKQLVFKMIKGGSQYFMSGINGACKMKNHDMVKYLLGNFSESIRWSSGGCYRGLPIACRNGNINIINL